MKAKTQNTNSKKARKTLKLCGSSFRSSKLKIFRFSYVLICENKCGCGARDD